MGKLRSEPVKYHCANDCDQMGCLGHELVVEEYVSTTTVFVDGKQWYSFDDHCLDAIQKARSSDKKRVSTFDYIKG